MPDRLTPQARISAAVEKLQTLRGDYSGRPWKVTGGGANHDDGMIVIADAHVDEVDTVAWNIYDGTDAQVMATMCHPAMLDATLSILIAGRSHARQNVGTPSTAEKHALLLADAIVGGES